MVRSPLQTSRKDPWLRLEGLFWDFSQIWRRPLKWLLTELSILRFRWRARGKRKNPSIRVATPRFSSPFAKAAREQELFIDWGAPIITGEALRMAAAAEDLDIVIAGPWSGRDGIPFDARLLAEPRAGKAPALLGRVVPILCEGVETGSEPELPTLLRLSSPYLLRPDILDGALIRRPIHDVERALARLPTWDSDDDVEPSSGFTSEPETTIFLLPFLAVGGAERLLFGLLEDLVRDPARRYLVVTLDPHRSELGQTVDRCLELTPFVFTLGDWMPREATWSALRHLIRRFRVSTLFSWNGTVDFFDRVHELKSDFPRLRLLSQLYHHRGAWTARTSPAVIRSVDRHVAVNRAIAEALEKRGTPRDRIALVHHGVAVPEAAPSLDEKAQRRRELGLPPDVLVVGTFIRLHAQKRPLDILALARRFAHDGVYFLLVGGGPMDGAIDAELERAPIPNLIRHGMTREPLPLYDALDLCLMTSSYEGLPVFLLDGLARGVPGVAPAVGDIPLLFADGGGLSVDEPGDLDGLESALRRLMDTGERSRRGEIARQTVEGRFGLGRYQADYRRELGLEAPP